MIISNRILHIRTVVLANNLVILEVKLLRDMGVIWIKLLLGMELNLVTKGMDLENNEIWKRKCLLYENIIIIILISINLYKKNIELKYNIDKKIIIYYYYWYVMWNIAPIKK